MAKTISPFDLIPMDIFTQDFPSKIHLAYQKDEPPNIFGKIYPDEARLWLHKDLAAIVLLASQRVEQHSLILYDGLRTVEAQALMSQSDIVKDNPHWLEEPGRLLSPPGGGAHPRGMAIDLSVIDKRGELLDMGTDFDFLAEDSSPAHNPAHREYPHINEVVQANRDLLTQAMVSAASDLGLQILPLPQEWWDFRFPADIYEAYEPLSDAEVPETHAEALRNEIIGKIKNL